MGYSVEMKQAVIQKALLGNKSQREIANDAGIGLSTLRNWLKQYKNSGTLQLNKKEKRPQDWTAEERLSALIETGSLTDEKRVAWCRQHGLFAHHLEQWKADAIAGTAKPHLKDKSKEDRVLRKEIADLKKELSRKDKALAETAALLVLKKKSPRDMGGPRGRIISEADKRQVISLVIEACAAGARKRKAAEMLGLPIRTVQRWEKTGLRDHRKGTRAEPANKLSESEKKKIETVLSSQEYENTNPNQIVPILADKGTYLGSESTMYRILRTLQMNKHRDSSKPASRKRPETFIATGPNQVWCWDITYLPSVVKGKYYYLYMVMDVFSRMAVAYQVYGSECSTLAADMITDACLRENILKEQLVLHSDNGSPMKGVTMLAKLQDLGVMPSFSRPSVSNDNPYSESLFRTLKYRPEYPEHSFTYLGEARKWADNFVDWYNNKHQHSAIRFVTPADRHSGKDIEILLERHKVYLKAKERHPERWSGKTRNWDHIDSVALNKVNKPIEISAEIIQMKVAA